MTFVLILFFLSLIAMLYMIWSKVSLLRNNATLIEDDSVFIPEAKEISRFLKKNGKTLSLVLVALGLRAWVKSSVFLKKKSEILKRKIKKTVLKQSAEKFLEKKEVSNFLKAVSDYKKRISKIKDKIVEEEQDFHI